MKKLFILLLIFFPLCSVAQGVTVPEAIKTEDLVKFGGFYVKLTDDHQILIRFSEKVEGSGGYLIAKCTIYTKLNGIEKRYDFQCMIFDSNKIYISDLENEQFEKYDIVLYKAGDNTFLVLNSLMTSDDIFGEINNHVYVAAKKIYSED